MSKERAKGTTFESLVSWFLRENGHPHVERRAMSGSRDRGDIAGLRGWVIECKATQRIELGVFMNEAEREAEHAGVKHFAAVVKRRQHSIGNAYAVLPLWLFADMLRVYIAHLEAS